jgi:hypothetical protein
MITYRESCGGLRGMLAHQAAGEIPCGWCFQAEQVARLTAEAMRPGPRETGGRRVTGGGFLPVSEEETSARRAVLMAEVEAFERDHPEGSNWNTKHKHLRRVV